MPFHVLYFIILTIPERLKDLRVERGLTLEQLAEQTNLSKSALGSYEAENFKDISHYALESVFKPAEWRIGADFFVRQGDWTRES